MEQKQKPSARPATREEDVDLGHLFYKTGGAINNFFSWLGVMFKAIGRLLLVSLFFLRKNLLWLVLGTVLGMGYGFYLVQTRGNTYFSNMTVQANYNSTRALYSSIDYFNALVNNDQFSQVSKILNLSEAEARSINGFHASPIVTELIAADLYKNRFLNLYHNTRLRMDTFWIKTITYEDFKSTLTKYDYPLHMVKVTSNNPTVFSKMQAGIINHVSNNELLQQEKASGNESNQQEVDLLESSIKSLDTLRNTYNKRLAAIPAGKEQSTNVTLLDGNVAVNNPELQLYDKMLQLKDELKMVRSQAVLEKDILQVLAPFGAIGQREGLLQTKIVRYAYIGFLLTLLVLLMLAAYKGLGNLEKKMAREKTSE